MAGTPTAAELATAARWCAASFSNPTGGGFPISFRYGGRESSSFLEEWTAERLPAPADETTARQQLKFTDPRTGLQCRCEVTLFAFSTLGWASAG